MRVGAAERGTRGGPIGHCPACGGGDMRAVTDGFETNFLCSSCGKCWHVSFGRASQVDPASCPGCERASACLGRLVEQNPNA